MKEQDRMLIKVAYYYYKAGITQEEIAEKLLISRQKVNRMIKKALEDGIVKITIDGYNDYNVELESEIEKKFGLKEAVVINSEEKLTELLGIAAANYLDKIAGNDEVIGLSWGRTLQEMATNLSKRDKQNISVVQLVGGMNMREFSILADEITREVSKKFNGTPYNLYAPAIVVSSILKEALSHDPGFKKIFEMMQKCSIAVVGIGALNEDATLVKEKYITGKEYQELVATGSVGDICMRYFDIDGNLLQTSFDSRVIGIDISQLKNINTVIGVAGGQEKVKAILGALRGKHINVLITDSNTADMLLAYD